MGLYFTIIKLKKVRNLVSTKPTKWFQAALKIIDDYTKRTPNSFHEVKSYSLTWHYRQSPADFGDFQAKNLVADLKSCFSHLPVSVISGKKVVEIKSREANKGRFSDWFMDRHAKRDTLFLLLGMIEQMKIYLNH